jgi:hypothetical protein
MGGRVVDFADADEEPGIGAEAEAVGPLGSLERSVFATETG